MPPDEPDMKSTLRVSHTKPARWPLLRPERFAATIRTDSPKGCQVALLGLPDDTGVRLNHGRPGAAQGPAAFRSALASLGTTWDGWRGRPMPIKVFDAGDVPPSPGRTEAALLETHARVEQAAAELHQLGLVPVCIGGGHDLTLPAVSALARAAGTAVGGVSFDAHLDVRPELGSGMAFRRLIQSGRLDPTRFVVVGLGRFVNERAHLKWLAQHGAQIVFADTVLTRGLALKSIFRTAFSGGQHGEARKGGRAGLGSHPGFVTIDLDGLDASLAPGVSAMNPLGLTVRDGAALAEAAGADPRVQHFDLMELSPRHDPSGGTARIAAFLFLAFVAGFGERLS